MCVGSKYRGVKVQHALVVLGGLLFVAGLGITAIGPEAIAPSGPSTANDTPTDPADSSTPGEPITVEKGTPTDVEERQARSTPTPSESNEDVDTPEEGGDEDDEGEVKDDGGDDKDDGGDDKDDGGDDEDDHRGPPGGDGPPGQEKNRG